MIEDFEIDINRGYRNQVGLHLRAAPEMAQQFRRLLWREGLNSVPYMQSNRSEFRYFTFVSAPDSGLDKQDVCERLRPLCQANRTTSGAVPTPDYVNWQRMFNDYVQGYRAQHFSHLTERQADIFDKARAYALIQSARYDEAERFLLPFATDNPPILVPVYLIYLYHEWHRLEVVAETHRRYESLLRSGDVDHRVIEWVIESYLTLTPSVPERALDTLNDFLPEFQRQGVADRLLVLRAQARALQGKLPQTAPDLRLYLTQTSIPSLAEHLDELLDVIVGLPSSTIEIKGLLDELTMRVEPAHHWRVTLEQSALARRENRLAEALTYLQPVLKAPPSDLEIANLEALRLDAANLYLALDQPAQAVETLTTVVPENLTPAEQRTYWGLLGRTQLNAGHLELALEALHRAYQLETRTLEILQPLARLAYEAEDWSLARRVYKDLMQLGFEPGVQDRLYAGILAWLDDDKPQVVDHLGSILVEPPFELVPANTLALAYEALVEGLLATRSPTDRVAAAISNWIDVLVAVNDTENLIRLAERIPAVGLDRSTTFALLEAIEPSLTNHPVGHKRLAQYYAQLLYIEIDTALRHEQTLPDYTLDLRRGLFELDREQFEFSQTYLQDELRRAREAELVEADFALEPSKVSTLDLHDRWIALVGGYEPVRRRVRERLARDYSLGRFTEVPPSWEAHIDQTRVAEAVSGADLIVVVHRCIKHDGTDALSAVIEGTKLAGRVRYAAGKGHSSVVRVIQEYFGMKE